MMNIENGPTSGKEQVSILIKLGDDTIWSSMHDIFINEIGPDPTTILTPTVVRLIFFRNS